MSRHRPDWLSFLCGLIFVLAGLVYMIAPVLGLRVHVVWALPALFVALGAAGLVGTRRTSHGRDGPDGPDDPD